MFKVSCLMAAFRKGHTKVVKWMVNHVTQFPSDQEMIRYISTVSDKDLLEKCQECVKIIRAAKETQAAKANKNATILLEELDMEKNREESKKAAAARRRERKKKKKLEKKEEKRKLHEENKKNENYEDKDDKKSEEDNEKQDEEEAVPESTATDSSIRNVETQDKEEGDSGIDANSQGSCSSQDVKSKEKRKDKKKKKTQSGSKASNANTSRDSQSSGNTSGSSRISDMLPKSEAASKGRSSSNSNNNTNQSLRKGMVFEASRHPAEREDFEATGNETYIPSSKNKKSHSEALPPSKSTSSISPKQAGKREEGWKEVVRKSSVQAVSTTESGVKKVSVPLNAISRVIGRGGSNINAIRGATGAHIEVEKQSKGQGERIITIKGSADATKQAHSLIATLIKDPDVDILQMLPKANKTVPTGTSLWDKTQIGTKKVVVKALNAASTSAAATSAPKSLTTSTTAITTAKVSTVVTKPKNTTSTSTARVTAPRLAAQAEKNAAAAAAAAAAAGTSTSRNTTPFTSNAISSGGRAIVTKVITTTSGQTFAAKLTETSSSGMVSTSQTSTINKVRTSQPGLSVPQSNIGPISPQAPNQGSPKHHRPAPTASAPPTMQHFQAAPGKPPFSAAPTGIQTIAEQTNSSIMSQARSPTPVIPHSAALQLQDDSSQLNVNSLPTASEYSLFNSISQQPMWRRENESQKPVNFAAVTGGGSNQASSQPKFIDQEPPPQVDASKAPGYKGNAICSPVSSKTSSNSTTPPNMPLSSGAGFPCFQEPIKAQTLPPIGTNIMHNRPASQANQNDHYYGSSELPTRSIQHLTHSDTNLYKTGASSFSDTASTILNDAQHLLPSYHQSNAMQHMSFSQSQQQPAQPAVSMSRLNPKAPDFSSSMHSMPKQPQMFNGYMGSQNGNGLFQFGKCPLQRSNVGPRTGNWQLMQMQQPFTQQQSELISGMATGKKKIYIVQSLCRSVTIRNREKMRFTIT